MRKLYLALFLTTPLFAAQVVTTWKNPACDAGPCELKGARFILTKENDLRSRVAGNSVVAELETTSKADLKDYAFVQYLRGCHFMKSAQGVRMGVRDYLGRSGQEFRHRTWEIDSGLDADPIYSSYADAGLDELRGREVPRNASYYTANPNAATSYDWWSGLPAKVSIPKLYVTDAPTYSSLSNGAGAVALVTSLEFKLCLHRVSDIPRRIEDPRASIPRPIFCYDWSSNYQLNSAQTALEEKSGIAPECQL